MSRVFAAATDSASSGKSRSSPRYKMFIWDLGTDSHEPHEASIRTMAAIEYTNPASQLAHFSTAVRPSSVTPKKPTPTFPDAWASFKEFIQEYAEGKPPLLVSHNAAFDVTVLLAEARRNNIKIPSTWRFSCSLLLARSIYDFTTHNSQLALAARLGIPVNRPHDTSEDVIVLRRILLALDDKAVDDNEPLKRVVPALCLHAHSPSFFDRTPQISVGSSRTEEAKFFITSTGTKYHRGECKWLKRSKIPKNAPPPGFGACSTCRPDVEGYVVPKSQTSPVSMPRTTSDDSRKVGSSTASPGSTDQFFITKTGSKYHVEGCKWLGRSKMPVDSPPPGFKPCRTCVHHDPAKLRSLPAKKYSDDVGETTQSLPSKKDNAASSKNRSTAEAPYYVTETGKKYHLKGCRALRSRIPKNARPEGYEPCGICLPNLAYTGTPKVSKIS